MNSVVSNLIATLLFFQLYRRERRKQSAEVLDDRSDPAVYSLSVLSKSRLCGFICTTLLLHICRDWEVASQGVFDPAARCWIGIIKAPKTFSAG